MNEYADTGIFLLLPLYNLHYSSVQLHHRLYYPAKVKSLCFQKEFFFSVELFIDYP